jgi:hypothetical protein
MNTSTIPWWRWIALGAAVVAALVITVTAVSAAAPAPAQRDFEVFTGPGFLHKIDEAPAGTSVTDLSPGDTLLHHDPVLDPNTGQQIGTAVTRVGAVQNLDGADKVILVDCTVQLADGDVVFYGADQLSRVQTTGTVYAITGGTRSYVGADGTVTVRLDKLQGKDGFRLAFDFPEPRH